MDQADVNPTLKTLLEEMKKDGVDGKKILEVAEQIGKATAAKLYTEMMMALTKEDIAEANKLADQAKASELIKERFFQRTQKKSEEIRNQILTDMAQAYLDSYRKQKH